MVSTLGGALALGTVFGVISFTGRSLFDTGENKPFSSRLAYKEEAKARFRRPLNETINELGEGRGKIFHWRMVVRRVHLTRHTRYLRSGIRGETKTENQGKLWH